MKILLMSNYLNMVPEPLPGPDNVLGLEDEALLGGELLHLEAVLPLLLPARYAPVQVQGVLQ